MEAQNTFSARKVNLFGVFWRNIGTKNKNKYVKYVTNVTIFQKIKNIEL